MCRYTLDMMKNSKKKKRWFLFIYPFEGRIISHKRNQSLWQFDSTKTHKTLMHWIPIKINQKEKKRIIQDKIRNFIPIFRGDKKKEKFVWGKGKKMGMEALISSSFCDHLLLKRKLYCWGIETCFRKGLHTPHAPPSAFF